MLKAKHQPRMAAAAPAEALEGGQRACGGRRRHRLCCAQVMMWPQQQRRLLWQAFDCQRWQSHSVQRLDMPWVLC